MPLSCILFVFGSALAESSWFFFFNQLKTVTSIRQSVVVKSASVVIIYNCVTGKSFFKISKYTLFFFISIYFIRI